MSEPASTFASDLLEIERKYSIKENQWSWFINVFNGLKPVRTLIVSGPDTYFTNGDLVLRWRYSKELSELTIKQRYSSSSTLVRKETDIRLIRKNKPKHILTFIKALGFNKAFRIYKDCSIFWFKDQNAEMCAVAYRVRCKGKKDRLFVELEPTKGTSIAVAKQMIRDWENKLGLKSWARINKSLYEIYSGKTMPVYNGGDRPCIRCGKIKKNNQYFPTQLEKNTSICKACCNAKALTKESLKTTSIRNKKRRETDLNYKLKCRLRTRLNQSLKGAYKTGSAVADLGCTMKELREYIEKQFYNHPLTGEAMAWSNWGKGKDHWQLDHIKPLHKFDLTKRSQLLKATNFKNLQPLWYDDHRQKTNQDIKK